MEYYSKFSRANKEVVINRIGKKPYSKELTNLILTRIDYETSFFHAHADTLMSTIVEAFGGEESFAELFYDREFSNIYAVMDFLKKKYLEGERIYEEYVQYLGSIGASNISHGDLEEFLRDRETKRDENYNYNMGIITLYEKYGTTYFLNIIALDKKIAELEEKVKEEDKIEEKRKEIMGNNTSGGKNGLSKIMAIFKRD